MKIRSITYFLDPGYPLEPEKFAKAGEFITQAKPAYEEAGYEVQTTRIATTPFPEYLGGLLEERAVIAAAQEIEAGAHAQGYDYIALGPAQLSDLDQYSLIPKIIAATETVFASAEMATQDQGVSLPAVRACAEIIHQLAPQDRDGFANLYFTALANVSAGSPFFPAAYHAGGEPQFAIATEAASLAVQAFDQAQSLQAGISALVESVETHAAALTAAGKILEEGTGVRFGGIDFSLAPFPDQANSIATALEKMGVPGIGNHGSLSAVALIANALDQADFPRVGFSGLLLPQLEDAVLAQRAAENILSVKDLLMYSAVCGTGLDTVALPGDCPPEQMTPLLLDLAVLALRLDKPLTARLMPIPGKKAGDMTSFDFPFFANSRVLALQAEPLQGLLAGDETLEIKARVGGG